MAHLADFCVALIKLKMNARNRVRKVGFKEDEFPGNCGFERYR